MARLMDRSVSGLRWRRSALARAFVPDGARLLAPPGLPLHRLHLPFRSLPLTPAAFVYPVDFLPDMVSRAGSPVEAAPNRRQRRFAPAAALGLTGRPVVVAALRNDRWMVLHGADVVAEALAAGQGAIEAQVMPVNEALAGAGDVQKTFYPPPTYRKNLRLLRHLRPLPRDLDPVLLALADDIRTTPLVRLAHLYHPLPFPEFQDLATQVDDAATYTRLGMILRSLGPPAGRRILDLGCNVGFFLFSLARRNGRVSGLDVNPDFTAVGRRVAAARGLRIPFVTGPLEPGAFGPGGVLTHLDDHPVNDPHGRPWDLVTCFSILQWVEKHLGLESCRRILREISNHTEALLLDIPVNCAGVHLRAPVGRERAWLEDLLRDACTFREYVCLGQVRPYRVDARYVFHCRH